MATTFKRPSKWLTLRLFAQSLCPSGWYPVLHLLDTDGWSRDGDNVDDGHGREVDVQQNLKNEKSPQPASRAKLRVWNWYTFSLNYTNSFVFSASQARVIEIWNWYISCTITRFPQKFEYTCVWIQIHRRLRLQKYAGWIQIYYSVFLLYCTSTV